MTLVTKNVFGINIILLFQNNSKDPDVRFSCNLSNQHFVWSVTMHFAGATKHLRRLINPTAPQTLVIAGDS